MWSRRLISAAWATGQAILLNIIDGASGSSLSYGMNKLSLLHQMFPQNSARYSCLPIFGAFAEDFAQWLQALTYTRRLFED